MHYKNEYDDAIINDELLNFYNEKIDMILIAGWAKN